MEEVGSRQALQDLTPARISVELRTEWTRLFKEVFDSLSEPFSVVLNAAGCREGWLQGEFFRRLHVRDHAFVVSEHKIGPRAKADLYGEKPSRMVAEIKVYGLNGYQKKNMDGLASHIAWYVPEQEGQRVDITREQINGARSGSLLYDLFRLQHVKGEIEKYLILVIQKAKEVDTFGEAIQAVRGTPREATFDYADFFVRIWQV